MDDYVRFTHTPSVADEYSPLAASPRAPSQSGWRRLWQLLWGTPHEPPPASGYLTLIPLSDRRLKPRHTKLWISILLLLAVCAVSGVFILVPRGVSVGTVRVHSTKSSFNQTTMTYRILLLATVPFLNPNYVKVRVAGRFNVSFYDQLAGATDIVPTYIRPRSDPQVLEISLDASNLPQKYTQVIYTHCFNFPRKLIFFLSGKIYVQYLSLSYELPAVDTYFIMDCSSAGDGDGDENSRALGHGGVG